MYTDRTFGIFPRPHERSWGISFVELPESIAHFLKIAVVELTELGGKAAMVDSAGLMEGRNHFWSACRNATNHEPTFDFVVVGITK